jgi:beta-glucosidase
MRELAFPEGFLWGTATAAHQVEGDNSNSDWWDWELKPGTPCKEPSGSAIEHYRRYPRDIALLKNLNFNTYRFSVEWARIEPSEGVFDAGQLDHYRSMVDSTLKAGMTPMVTLNHFTLPKWVAKQGGWLWDRTPALFERYVRRVVQALGDDVTWYCTINEPGVVSLGGYMGAFAFPPGTHGLGNWKRSIAGLVEGHKLARAAVKEIRPNAQVGMTHAMQEWEGNDGGWRVIGYMRGMYEDVFLEACRDDEFVGVQTYTRTRIELPGFAGVLGAAAFRFPPTERLLAWLPVKLQRSATNSPPASSSADAVRRTQMGWEFRPQAAAATVRRVHELMPGKAIIVTEHGVATADDAERIEFITEGLKALYWTIKDGVNLRGYIHWSAFDNFEWAHGYAMQFGLIGVDRTTQERTIKPSAKFLGEIARTNRLKIEG